MKEALNYSDSVIRDGEVGDLFLFRDNSVEIITDKFTDKVQSGRYFNTYLIQINLVNIKKNGKLGKLGHWLKFEKLIKHPKQ